MMKLTRITLAALAGTVMLTACSGGTETVDAPEATVTITETDGTVTVIEGADADNAIAEFVAQTVEDSPGPKLGRDLSLAYTCGPTITVDASVTNTSTVRAWAELIVTDAEGEFFAGDETTVLDPGESADMSFPEFEFLNGDKLRLEIRGDGFITYDSLIVKC